MTPLALSLHLGLESMEARKVTIWCIEYGILSKTQNEFVQPCRVEHGAWVINRGKLYSDTTTTSTLRQTCQKFIFIRNEILFLSKKHNFCLRTHNFGECKQVRKQKRKKRKHFVAVSSLWPQSNTFPVTCSCILSEWHLLIGDCEWRSWFP